MGGAVSYGQSDYSTSTQIQSLINQAVASGQSLIELPDHVIYVTSTIIVPIGTRDLTIQGGPNTRLVRAAASDITLMRIGDDYTFAISNAQLPVLFQAYDLRPASEGQSYVELVGGGQLAPGYVILAGVDPAADYVRHATNTTTYWYKRELTKVINQVGNRLNLVRPLGRDFEYATLYYVQQDAQTSGFRITKNITLKNFTIDGAYESGPLRSVTGAKGTLASRGLVLGSCDNCLLEGITVTNVRNNGILAKMSRYITINNCTVRNMSAGSRYAIEFDGSRSVAVNSPHFENVWIGVLFQSGTMDGTVTDSVIAPGHGVHDVGHGTGEKRIRYIRCVADDFLLANYMWRAGVDGIHLLSCSARDIMSVYGGADNILIEGRHAAQPVTARSMYLFTQTDGNPFPTGSRFVGTMRVSDGVFLNDQGNGQTMLLNYSAPGQFEVGDWTFERCQFINPRTGSQNGGASIDLLACQSEVSSILFDGCQIENSNGYQPPVRFGANSGSGVWNVRFRNCNFTNPIAGGLYDTHSVRIFGPSDGQFIFGGNTFNGGPLAPIDVINNGSAAVLFE